MTTKFGYLLLLTALAGCVPEQMTSFVNPAYRGRQFHRVLVQAHFGDFIIMHEFETRVVHALGTKGYYAIAQSDVMPPVRSYSDSECTAFCRLDSIDARLVVFPIGEMLVTSTGLSEGWLGVEQTSKTTKQSTGTEAILIDPTNNEVIWRGQSDARTANSESTVVASMDRAILGFARRTAIELDAKHLLVGSSK